MEGNEHFLLARLRSLNARIRSDIAAIRIHLALRRRETEAKYNPNWRNQPRAPRGDTDGGQWVGEGGRGKTPKQALPRPVAAPAASAANDNDRIGRLEVPRRVPTSPPHLASLSLRGLGGAVALAAPLSGDTPRPIIDARLVPGAHDLLLVRVDDRQSNTQSAYFARIVTPERRQPLIVFGVDTGITTTTPAVTRRLDVDVEIVAGAAEFNPRALAVAYGRHIPGVTAAGTPARELGIVTHDAGETALVVRMRSQGATRTHIELELDNFRTRSNAARHLAPRRRPGIAHSSRTLPVIEGRWLLGSDGNAGLFPEQVARQLRGREFISIDAFRAEFWRAVANVPELASQFTKMNQTLMRLGYAPFAPRTQWHGAFDMYMLHHRTPIARGGAVYDMSNIVIVSPRFHQAVLDGRYHFKPDGVADDARRDD